jgi:CubicO group peptidase (beta-lactamase class C family)
VRGPLLFQAGEKAQYSDPGYILLGMIIEKASGQPYRDFVQKRIFDPLQMSDSSVMDQWRIIKNRVAPYMIRNGKLLRGRRDWQFEVASNFGIYSTVEDLAKFDAALLNNTLLKKSVLDQMWTPATLKSGEDAVVGGQLYGFGWEIGDLRGHRTVSHGGFSGTLMTRLRDEKLTIIVLTNLDVASGPHVGVLVNGIAGLLKQEYQPPHMLTPQPDPSPQTTLDLRKLMSDLAAGQDSPLMTAGHRAFYNSMPAPYRSNYSQQLKSLKSLTYIGCDNVEGRGLRLGEPLARICYYRIELGEKAFYYTFWLTREGKVASLRYYPE